MLNDKLKEIVNNLERNMKNKEDLSYAKAQVMELTIEFLNELERLHQEYDEKIKLCEYRINELEMTMQRLENEMFQEELDDDTDLEPIKCPYCNTNFFIEFDNSKKEIQCPDCKNIIELDWGNFEDDM